MDRKKLAKNLKLVDSIPREIERQQAKYKATITELDAKDKTGDYARNDLAKKRQAAKEERDRTCAALAKSLRTALQYVQENNRFSETETVDFSNPKLQDALRTIEFMGKDLSPADQANILNNFAGDVGALRLLEKAYRKQGYYLKDAAHEMQKGIPEDAISDMFTVLAFYDYAAAAGRFDFPIERAHWTKGEFAKALDRLSLDNEAAEVNPYSAVLDALSDSVEREAAEADYSGMSEEERRLAIARANAKSMSYQTISHRIKEAKANGEDPARILNRQLAKMEEEAAARATEGATV